MYILTVAAHASVLLSNAEYAARRLPGIRRDCEGHFQRNEAFSQAHQPSKPGQIGWSSDNNSVDIRAPALGCDFFRDRLGQQLTPNPRGPSLAEFHALSIKKEWVATVRER